MALAFSGGSLADTVELNPAYRYLRVVVDGRSAMLVLGYLDADSAAPGRRDIEVWYSGEGEVIRLRNGRIAGTSGLTTDWRSVSAAAAPEWGRLTAMRSEPQPVATYERRRDESGYRVGITDRVQVFAISPPRGTALAGLPADSLLWFEERAIPVAPPADSPQAAPLTSRYAVRQADGKVEVVYAEHCLSAALCLSLQRWPPR